MNGIERARVGRLPLWGWGLVCSALIWALYVLTLAPTTGFWDTSEYVTTAHILGIAHPPGSPLFMVVGRTFDLLTGWTGLSVAARINLMGATLSAGASFFWFLAMARIVAHFRKDPREVAASAAIAVLVGATAFTVWSQSNLNEKVYTVSIFVVALVSYLALRWKDEANGPRGDRLLLLIGLILGLGAANHTMSILPVPALALFALVHRWKAVLRPAVLAGGIGLFLVGFAVQLLFVPIRSAQNPIIDEADPECAPLWDAITPATIKDRSGATKLAVKCEPLALSLIRDQYAKAPLAERQAPFAAQMANYWQYFDWQWARSLGPGPRAAVSMLFLFFALVGLWTHYQGDRRTFTYLGSLLFTLTLLLIYYLNFKYGYSIYNDTVPDLAQHEVRERDYFYIIGFQVWGLYAGLGIVSLWSQLAASLDGSGGGATLGPGGRRAAPVLAIAFIPVFFNYAKADRTGDYAARDWAYNILQSVEPYGVLFTNGDNDTFPLWYLQEVEGLRRDVTVIVHSYLGTSWYPKQLRELARPCAPGVRPEDSPTTIVCQRPFDLENAVGPYADASPPAPTRSIIAWDDATIDGLDPGFQVPSDTAYAITPYVAGRLRGGDVILYPDIMVFHILQQSLGDRPVYFAATAAPVYAAWNLQPHLVRHGLAYKVVDAPMLVTEDRVNLMEEMPGFGSPPWIDRERTDRLLWEVFRVDYLEDWEEWPEPSTESSIPTQYWVAYTMLGLAHQKQGDAAGAQRAYARAEKMLRLSDIEEP